MFRAGFICQSILNNVDGDNGALDNDLKERLRIQLGYSQYHVIDYYCRE